MPVPFSCSRGNQKTLTEEAADPARISRRRGILRAFGLGFALLGSVSLLVRGQPRGPNPDLTPETRPKVQPSEQPDITATELTQEGDWATAVGFVVLKTANGQLKADELLYNLKTGDVTAWGNVVLEESGQVITGERLVYNTKTATGILYDVWGVTGGDVWFEGKSLEKTGDKKYTIRDGTITPCDQPTPYWDFKVQKAKLVLNKHVRFQHMRLRFKHVPVLYLPYFQYPINTERKTGFLFPSFGTNSQRGFFLGETFFWAVSRSMDATFSWEYYSKDGNGLGTEFRYIWSRETQGNFSSYLFFPKEGGGRQGSYRFDHRQSLPLGFDASVHLDWTDATYDQKYSRNVLQSTRRVVRSWANATRKWGGYSFSVGANQYRYFQATEQIDRVNTNIKTQWPMLNFSMRSTKLGPTPVYVSLASSAFGISDHPEGEEGLNYERYDMASTFSMPIKSIPWLSVTPALTARETYYTKSYVFDDPEAPGTAILSDRSYRRDYMQARLDVTGPRFYRVFFSPGWGYTDRVKHLIEPRIIYVYTPDIEDADRIIRFDSTDRLSSLNEVTFRLANYWIAKRTLSGTTASPYVFLTVGLEQKFSLDKQLSVSSGSTGSSGNRVADVFRTRSPLLATISFKPVRQFDIDSTIQWDTQFQAFKSAKVSGHIRQPRWGTVFTWSKANRVIENDFEAHAIDTSVDFAAFPGLLDLSFGLNYDFKNDLMQLARTRVNIRNQCCGVSLEYVRNKLYLRDENEFRFNIWLKNIGGFFDFNPAGGQ